MGIMKKIAPVALALGLGARALFGNPLESTIIKEEPKKEPFSLESSLSYEGIGEDTFNAAITASGEYKFDSGYKILGDLRIDNGLPTKAVLAAGHPNMYLGAKWENLSGETSLLEGANLFKVESGVRNIANFLDMSSFFAYTSIPNMKTRWGAYKDSLGQDVEYSYDTPFQLYTFGIDGIARPKFELENSTITPWLSGKILINSATAQNAEKIDSAYDYSSFAYAFNHFDVGLGADFSMNWFDFGLENHWEGSYDPSFAVFPISGTKHKVKIGFHDKENFLQYSFTANPQFNLLDWPANWDLQSDVDFRFHFTPEVYIKGNLNMNHSTIENPNFIAALGYLNKEGTNVELFCNLKSKTMGITLSSRNLGNKLERYSKEPFAKISPSAPNIYPSNPSIGVGNVAVIHGIYGEDISDVVSYIKSRAGSDYSSVMSEVSKYASYFEWIDDNHNGTYTAEQEHDLGYGVCRDTNGKLLPTVINGILGSKGYKSWGKALFGPYVGHVLTIIKKPNGRYDIMNYKGVYLNLNAETEQKAIDRAYPGAYAYDGGQFSETSQRVIKALEESVWK